jgi:phytoene synthase
MDISDKYCQEKAAQSGSSFYYGFLFLTPVQRQAIMAVYAFCREVDDIVDECTEKDIANQKLNWWNDEIERIFLEKAEHPIGIALQKARKQFLLKKEFFQEILCGMQMDLKYQGYQKFEDLERYCYCVASAVGLLSVEIFGFQDQKTLDYAKNLGIALQLINIIRDVGEDATRGRIYIPELELEKFSVNSQDILNKKYSDNFYQLMQFQATRAKEYYQKALGFLSAQDTLKQRAGLIMAEIYTTLLKEIEKSNYQVLHQKISLTPLRKLWISWKVERKLKKNYQATYA